MDYFDLLKSHPSMADDHNSPLRLVLDKRQIRDWQKERRSQLRQKPGPLEWADIGVVLDDQYVVIVRDLVEFPNGFRNGYIRMYNRASLESGAAGVVVLPVKEKRILVMRIFRHATRSWHWEIPRGFGESGLSAEENARKEIEEETGGVIHDMVDLGVFHSNTGLDSNTIFLYMARMVSIANPEQAEGIATLRWISVREMERMIRVSEITDGFTIAAYARAKLRRLI
jgi:ADP-ribose pyrophosphatase